MKYYEPEHAAGYECLRAARLSSWGQLHGDRTFEDSEIRTVLAEALPRVHFNTPHPTALEYGCGTGPGACWLAERGLRVRGVDLSPVAIEIAKREAAVRNLSIDYHVADLCDPAAASPLAPGERFDLIVDSFCLQCIVTDDDRARLFALVHSALHPAGHYLIVTAGFSPARDYGNCRFDTATGIVLEPQPDGSWLPCRRHITTDQLARELSMAGFTALWYRTAQDGDIALVAGIS